MYIVSNGSPVSKALNKTKQEAYSLHIPIEFGFPLKRKPCTMGR